MPRRPLLVVLLTVVLLATVAACRTTATGPSPRASTPPATAPATAPATGSTAGSAAGAAPPSAPAGMRWQGTHGFVVAVPSDWATSTDPCGWPDRASVRVLTRQSLMMRCPFETRHRDVPVLTIVPTPHGLQVTYQGPRRPHFLATVRDSMTMVPTGWTTVPVIAPGRSDEAALSELERAGLDGSLPDVDWPHYVVGTDPAPGTLVERGSVVVLQIGDG